MAEWIMEGCRSAVVGRFRGAIQLRPVSYRSCDYVITVEHFYMERDRGTTGRVGGSTPTSGNGSAIINKESLMINST